MRPNFNLPTMNTKVTPLVNKLLDRLVRLSKGMHWQEGIRLKPAEVDYEDREDERNPAVNSMLDRLERLSKVTYAQIWKS